MRSRHTITAAMALAVVTILAVAACGSSVQGAAQVNTSALETMTGGAADTALPTDLSDLSSALENLPTDLSIPTDLTFPTDFTIPTELTDLNIPGYNSSCITVGLAYAAIGLAILGTFGGQGQYDSADLQQSIEELTANVPAELQGDVQALAEIAAEANGKSLAEAGELFSSEKWNAASKNIEDWVNANCSGG